MEFALIFFLNRGWASSIGGGYVYVYTEIHRLGILSVNHKSN